MDRISYAEVPAQEKEEYYRYCLTLPIQPNVILIEAGQGWNVNGSCFALLLEIERNENYRDLQPYFTVRPETEEAAAALFARYGFQRVKTVTLNTEVYKKVLATAQYLVTDNSFPVYFIKRDEQRYLNTWHGTPLKKLGRSNIRQARSLGNVQKNYLASDFILFPNEYTRDIFFRDFMLDGLYSGTVVLSSYPRNNRLHAGEVSPREILGDDLGDFKRLIAYMPTWRPADKDDGGHVNKIQQDLELLDTYIPEDTVLLVNLHFNTRAASLDYGRLKHVKPFPEGFETYDVLSCCDALITDYSSVMFDYAELGRPIILYTYDLGEYIDSSGLYSPLEGLGFIQVSSVAELIAAIELAPKCPAPSKAFIDAYCGHVDAHSSEKLLDLLTRGEASDLHVENVEPYGNNVGYFAGDMSKPDSQQLFLDRLELVDFEAERPVLLFSNTIDETIAGFLDTLPDSAAFVRLPPIIVDEDAIAEGLKVYRKTGVINERLNRLYLFENERLLVNLNLHTTSSLINAGSRIEGLMAYASQGL